MHKAESSINNEGPAIDVALDLKISDDEREL